MQIIQDSGKTHWVIGRHLTCPQCETVFSPDSSEDFETYSTALERVGIVCPKNGCNYFFKVEKHKHNKVYEPLSGKRTMPWNQLESPSSPKGPKITFTSRGPEISTGVGSSLADVLNKLNNTRARSPTSH